MKQIFTLLALLGALALQAQNTFIYKTKNAEIILLSEGQRASNLNNLIGATEEIIEQTAPEKTYPGATNAFLIRTKGKNMAESFSKISNSMGLLLNRLMQLS